MKIEKISDTQIRCTLSKTDLQSREIKISELAYGTEKAKSLFHDMMDQATKQFGFEADNLPLMIEAIPVSLDCIVLIITKVDDPEELDTRFSKFTASEEDLDDVEFQDDGFLEYDEMLLANHDDPSDHILDGSLSKKESKDNFIPISESLQKTTEDKSSSTDEPDIEPEDVSKLFSFVTWNEASLAAHNVAFEYKGKSRFYKDIENGIYFLLLHDKSEDNNYFFKVCNTLTEYGKKEKFTFFTNAYLTERCDLLIKENAIHILSQY